MAKRKKATAEKAEKAKAPKASDKENKYRSAKGKPQSKAKPEHREPQEAYFSFDFDEDGGAEDSYVLRGDEIPEGAVVFWGVVDVERPFKTKDSSPLPEGPSHADGVIALHMNGNGDLLAPSRAQFWSIGRKQLRVNDSGDAIIAGATGPRLEVKGRDITQGKLEMTLRYFEPGEDQLNEIKKREQDRKAADARMKAETSEKAQKQKQADAIAAKIVSAL
jgi:hypothetical protein